jgi:hypothetical protein
LKISGATVANKLVIEVFEKKIGHRSDKCYFYRDMKANMAPKLNWKLIDIVIADVIMKFLHMAIELRFKYPNATSIFYLMYHLYCGSE